MDSSRPRGSAPQKPRHEADHERNDETGGEREVETEAFALDVEVAGQAPERQTGEPRSKQPDQDDERTDEDEQALHEGCGRP
jgi:hypothetical protein